MYAPNARARTHVIRQLNDVASSARSNDVSNLKTSIVGYVLSSLPLDADALGLSDVRLPIPVDDESLHGFKCRATARALIPPEDLPAWDEGPDE